MTPRLLLALLLPFIACALQWLLWDPWIKPYVWFLFFPLAFFAAWLGGVAGGIGATLISAGLVWFVFIPPQFSLALNSPAAGFSIMVFVVMGGLFTWLFERLRQARESAINRFEATFEQAAVGIAQVAPDGRWLRVNRKLCAIVGYTPDELMAKTFQDITHPDDLNADLDQVQRMLARDIDTYSMEKRYVRKDGSLVWINLTVSLVWKADGAPDYFISVVEDIQARKQAEEATRQAQQRFRQLFDMAPVALSTSGRDGRVQLMNRAFTTLFGYNLDDTPTVADFRRRAMPDVEERQRNDADWQRRWQADEATAREPREQEMVCADGRRKTVLTTRMRLGEDMILAAVDITPQKAAENDLRRRNEDLERFDRASVGRELEMIRLKQQVNELSRALGRAEPHDLSFIEPPPP